MGHIMLVHEFCLARCLGCVHVCEFLDKDSSA